ncbi:unnamed protein product [Eruca vesicaria subsp. sativa]|uniref:Uncharacterized protein n=1 Tax=Eruca vesicaria subsp. sativa TaxID=29727 RepID=A0ABC8K5K1_ERUVS|nr:unnamed protein product [Eruca vesicaria subsp. sativa]
MSAPAKKGSTGATEKDLMLDKDVEKDTWNFKSMTDDDPMDLVFGSPVNKDKKKDTFKLDMDFDLGGDFGNFNMDMPDFDFSSPAKKTTKGKQSSDDSGNLKQKKKPFAFSYDFDALSDFDPVSSPLKKGNETTTKSMDSGEFAATKKFDKSDSFDFGPDFPTTRQAVSRANTDVKANASAEKENPNSKATDSMSSTHSKQADSNSSTHSKQAALESKENFEEVESPQRLRMRTSGVPTMRVQPQPSNISPLRESYSKVEENNKPCLSNETAAPSPLHSSETAHTAASRETSPGIHEICSSGTKEDSPRDPEENASYKMISATKSSYEKTEPNTSSQSCLDKIKHQQAEMDTDTPAEIQDYTRRTLCDPDPGLSQPTLSRKVPPGTRRGQTAQVQDSSSKLPQAPSDSVPRLSDLKTMQNKDSGHIRSMFFKKIEKPQSHVLESPNQTEIRPVTHERIGSNLKSTIDKRHDTEDALPGSKTRTVPFELAKTDAETAHVSANSSHEKIIQKGHSGTGTAMDHLKLLATNTTREKSNLQGNINSKPDASSLSQKLKKSLSSGGESLQKSKMVSLERPKLGNIMSDLRAATQRNVGGNKDQSSSAVQPEVRSSISTDRNTEAPVKKISEIHQLAPRDKTQTLHLPPSLKRKALNEDADRSLMPQLKRFSMSPKENRNVDELTHTVGQVKVTSPLSKLDNNTTKQLVKESPQTKPHPQIMNMANMEIPITEYDENIEKAESYTKELDNICNILKKKHEEAKELLVRAVNFAAKLSLGEA